MEFLEALNDLIKVSGDLNKSREEYQGYEFSYYYHYDIEVVKTAEIRFNKALDDRIKEAINKALNK